MGCGSSTSQYSESTRPLEASVLHRGDRVQIRRRDIPAVSSSSRPLSPTRTSGQTRSNATLVGSPEEMVTCWVVLVVDVKLQTYALQFADGHYEARVHMSKLVLEVERDWKVTGRDVVKPFLQCGTTVMAQTQFGRYSGIVCCVHGDSTFAVQTDFGDYFPKLSVDDLDPYD